MSGSGREKKGGSSYSQASDINNIGILFAGDGGSVSVSQRKRLKEILRG